MSRSIAVLKESGDLEIKDRTVPDASGRNILIEIHASSMNPHDWKFYGQFKKLYQRTGFFPDMLLGHDLSGVVIDVGPRVKKFKVGDEVYAMSAKTGAFGEHLTVDERMVALKPANLTHQEAASVPMAALTAWQAFILTKLKRDEEVLVIGGSGGVGIFAVQFAKILGANVTAVCSTANVDLVKFMGAHEVIDYKKDDYHESGKRFDVIFDVIGGQSKDSCSDILKENARFISTNTSVRNISEILGSRVQKLLGMNTVSSATFLAMPVGRHLEKITKMIEAGEVKTLVDKVFPLEDIKGAMDYSKQGRTRGKIVISVKE